MDAIKELQEKVEALAGQVELLQGQVAQIQKVNPLWGKKYIACGDSFTQGDFNGWKDENGLMKRESPVIWDFDWQMFRTYPWWIGKRNNMTVINDGLCGSTMALPKGYLTGENPGHLVDMQPFSLERYKRIPEDADYCTIWFGINDSANTYLGDIEDTTNETYYGAWNVVLEWLLINRPKLKIGIIITNDGQPQWREATRRVARKWGIPYLDMMGDPQVPLMGYGREPAVGLCSKAEKLRTAYQNVIPENGHPNLWAHEYQSTFIEAFLRRL